MASKWRRSNGLTTTAGEERLRAFLKSREEEVENVDTKIEEENNRLETCENAIYNLQLAIADGQKIFNYHEENLLVLQGVKKKLNGLEALTSWTTRPESTSEALCAKLKSRVMEPTIQYSDGIDSLTTLFEKETRPLWEEIGQLEMELEGWRLMHRAATLTLENLRLRRDAAEREMIVASQPFRSIWSLSPETWAEIFRLVKGEELSDYVRQNDAKGLRSVVFVLSHVCHTWRHIVFGQPSLWNLVYAPPVSAWRQDEYNLLNSSIQKCRGPVTLLTNAYQVFPKKYYPGQRYEKDVNTWASVVTPNEDVVFSERSYTLHINTQDDNSSYLQRISNIPFKQPAAIIYSAALPLRYGSFFNHVTCRTVRSFTIINNYPVALGTVALATCMPQLAILRLHIKQLPTGFSLAGWLPPTLQELYLWHEGTGAPFTIVDETQLPKLRILGVTSASTPIIRHVSMPELRTLILYGASDISEATQIAAGANADQVYRRVVHLRLEGWGRVNAGSVTMGAVSMLEKTISNTPGLHTIEFLDSVLDGESLVRIISGAMRGVDAVKLKYLEEITLNNVSGITRNECDQLKDMVPKLNIYV